MTNSILLSEAQRRALAGRPAAFSPSRPVKAADIIPGHLVRIGASTSYLLVTGIEPDGTGRIRVTFEGGATRLCLPGDEVFVSRRGCAPMPRSDRKASGR